MKLTPRQIADFQEVVWGYYHANARQLPWRDPPSPYKVVVSELMLQQTQVLRVIPKFEQFIARFPNWQVLARASLSEVLTVWSGLGYNRRAKFLWQTAQQIINEYGGQLPLTETELVKLPGIGRNTAGAIVAYAYNKPTIFIETNIRTVYFKHFFTADKKVSDSQLYELVLATVDREHPRDWYWALMDYGSYIKKTVGGQLDTSKHYKKQAPLAGSLREVRGLIIKKLVYGPMKKTDLRTDIPADQRFEKALTSLLHEGLIESSGDIYSLTGAVDAR